jgi:hypothetical protein
MRRLRPFRSFLLMSGALTLVVAPVLTAQVATLVGTVRRDSAGIALAGVEIVLPAVHRRTLANKAGEFRFEQLPLGRYALVARHVGFQPVQDSIVVGAGTNTHDILMSMSTTVTFDTMRVDAEERAGSPQLQAFEDRRAQGIGRFIGEAELRKADSKRLGDLVRSMPGLRPVYVRDALYLASTRDLSSDGTRALPQVTAGHPSNPFSALPNACWVTVYVDGIKIYDASSGASSAAQQYPVLPPNFNELMAQDFAGVEYYAGGASVPSEFNSTSSGCGTLLLWSRVR